jgi:hypothetical protein
MPSAQGRFTSPDFAGPDLTNPQTLNKYRYRLNNPLRYVDRNGLYEEDVHRDLTYSLCLGSFIAQLGMHLTQVAPTGCYRVGSNLEGLAMWA